MLSLPAIAKPPDVMGNPRSDRGNMKEHNKRWLISMMKTSGSKRRYLVNGSFSDTRNAKKYQDLENLATHESIGSTRKIYNGKLNYGLLVRFLQGQVGNDWDEVYSEIISRIPTKLLDYKEIVFWFVADKVEIINGHPYNMKTNRFDCTNFYVCPITNKLLRVEAIPSGKETKGLEKGELRKYREKEKKDRLLERKQVREKNNANSELAQKLLKENNKQR
ncbi:hypothetical protein LJC53_06915 [Bacteroidales bacterium OttesenSCG-928-C03]|nr:hypothetical protein [Bacteroidales bacterium OttesenSCG-928-C03]